MFPYHPLRVPPVLGNPTYFPSFLLRHTVFTSPIDLSIRSLAPITPPTTPSPIRTRVNSVDFVPKHASHKSAPILWKWNEFGSANYSQFIGDDSMCATNKLHSAIEPNRNVNGDVIDNVQRTDKCDYDLSIKEDYESDEDAFVDILTQDDADVSQICPIVCILSLM